MSGRPVRLLTAATITAAASLLSVSAASAGWSRGAAWTGLPSGCVDRRPYGFLSGAWPFGVVELVWSGVAVRRYLSAQPH